MNVGVLPNFPLPFGSPAMRIIYDGVPVGSVSIYMGKIKHKSTDEDTASNDDFSVDIEQMGWMVCDGRELKVMDYPELYMVLGTLYGGNASKEDTVDSADMTFKLPDLSGQFIRGVGTGKGSTETPGAQEDRMNPVSGEKGYTGVGSFQKDALIQHAHSYQALKAAAPTESAEGGAIQPQETAYTSTELFNAQNESLNKQSTKETRATNLAVYFIMKYTYQLQVPSQQ